jgi:hypothetical protein
MEEPTLRRVPHFQASCRQSQVFGVPWPTGTDGRCEEPNGSSNFEAASLPGETPGPSRKREHVAGEADPSVVEAMLNGSCEQKDDCSSILLGKVLGAPREKRRNNG